MSKKKILHSFPFYPTITEYYHNFQISKNSTIPENLSACNVPSPPMGSTCRAPSEFSNPWPQRENRKNEKNCGRMKVKRKQREEKKEKEREKRKNQRRKK